MQSIHSGAFGFVMVGRWLKAFEVRSDGSFVDRHGVALEPIDLDTEVLTVRAVASAVILAGKRTRLDVLSSAGLALPTEIGKGRNTLRRIIELRAGERAAQVIAAYAAIQSAQVQKAA